MKTLTIGVFGHYGNQNLGDEAITRATIDNLRKLLPHAEFVGMSINPFDTAWRYDIPVFPIRYSPAYFADPQRRDAPSSAPPADPRPTPPRLPTWRRILRLPRSLAGRVLRATIATKNELIFLRRARARLRDIDLIVVAGSNQFLDNFGGPWGFPYTLFKWTMLAKRSGTKIAFLSIGAGPILHKFSYRLLRQALTRADHLSYRDEGSRELVQSHIPELDGALYPDLAHALNDDLGAGTPSPAPRLDDNTVSVMINPMPVYDPRYWFDKDEIKYAAYVDELAHLTHALLQDGHAVTLFNTHPRDSSVADDIETQLQKMGLDARATSLLRNCRIQRLEELMALLDSADVVVATRFHATVLPLQLGKPTYGICYYRKAAELLDETGLSAYHVNIDDFEHVSALASVRELIATRAELRPQILGRHAHYRDALAEQFTAVAGLVND